MEFEGFKEKMQKHLDQMYRGNDHLFVVDLDRDALWELYLESFPEEMNPIYRERRHFDCSGCRQFIKNFGNVVVIVGTKIVTIWDFDAGHPGYQKVADNLALYIKGHPVSDVFVTKLDKIGIDKNREMTDDGAVITWEHFFTKLPAKFVSRSSDTESSIKGNLRDIRNVFERSLLEITEDSIQTVLEIIAQKSLYKGEEWESVLTKFLKLHKEYHLCELNPNHRSLWCWKKSLEVGPVIGKIRNHSIGVLLQNVSEEMPLDQAVKKYEAIVAPTNYKRPKAIYTKKMLETAKEKIQELGFENSLGRRFAMLDDISINNVLFANREAKKRISDSFFDSLEKDIAVDPKKFSKVEEITIENFLKDVLETTTEIELLLENRHIPNLVSLIAPMNGDGRTMFKWDNAFSWAYNGNITDSMKDRVKALGGRVDGDLRFSIQWNDENDNHDDLDAHCNQPGRNGTIFFQNKARRHSSSGMLDVDIIQPGNEVAVENIIFDDKGRMPEGNYLFRVHCYSSNGAKSGFSAEIEFDGNIYSFSYNKPLRQKEFVDVAEVRFSRRDGFIIKELIPSTASSRKAWELETNQFHQVSVNMFSPNYWDDQKGIGHRHYFFMLKDCVNETNPSGFFNEFLKEELLTHKRVFEALSSKIRVEDVEDQLSGLGFSSTKRNNVIVRVGGHTKRMLNIKF